jgi:hypothetical protein
MTKQKTISYMLLSSSTEEGNTWSKKSGRVHNLMHDDFDDDAAWSLTCNQDKITAGTLGFIYYADGSYGKISALFICYGDVWEEQESGGAITYTDGVLWRLPPKYEIDGARLRLDPDWSGRAPFTKLAHRKVLPFRNGEALQASDAQVLWDHLDPFVQDWAELKRDFIVRTVGSNEE